MAVHKILIIDDEKMIRQNLEACLEDTGYQVQAVHSGEEGLECLKSEKFDLLIVDLRLPGLNGIQVIIKALGIQSDLKILIYTAMMDFVLPPELEDLGLFPEQVLYKTITNLDQLLRQIKVILN